MNGFEEAAGRAEKCAETAGYGAGGGGQRAIDGARRYAFAQRELTQRAGIYAKEGTPCRGGVYADH